MMCAAIIFSHLNELTFRILCQSIHILGIRTAEFINVLVIVAHCYNTHLFIIGYQGIHKVVFFFSHVLSLVYDKYCLTDLGWFHFPLINHFGSFRDDVFGILKVSYSSQKVKTIGMKCFYLNKMGSISYQLHKPLFEFRGSRS